MKPEHTHALSALIALVKAVTKAVNLIGVVPAKTLFESLQSQGLADRESFDRLMTLVCSTGFVVHDGLVFRRATDAERAAATESAIAELDALQAEIRARREEAEKRG